MLGNKNERFTFAIKRFTFDIVMADVNLGDVDGFEFLKYISLNLEIPVILMKGIDCGACDYLVKPIRRKDLRYIWLYMFRKKMQLQNQFEDSLITGVCEDGSISGKKRKELEIAGGFSSSAKKPKAPFGWDGFKIHGFHTQIITL